VNTIRYLFTDPAYFEVYRPIVLAGLAIAVMSSLLSPLVVLKRLSFVGQGISHAAFGGIGIAAALAGTGIAAAAGTMQFPIVLAFCLLCAILIAWLIERGASQADTAIGIVLVASMTLGALLIQWAYGRPGVQAVGWESILFGSIASVGASDAAIAWAIAAAVLASAWLCRRPLLFWAFDEPAAPAFGVPGQSMKYMLVILLTLVIVTSMKLAGVVLATALIVLPGATALRLSDKLTPVFLISLACGVIGVVGGLILAFEADRLPPGACIVGILVLLFALARLFSRVQSARRAA
jgi:ABC-type Mn2+/Zn2+ transport system permease subunit